MEPMIIMNHDYESDHYVKYDYDDYGDNACM